MSRFSNLEFGHESDGQTQYSNAVVKDGAYYCAEAQAAFEQGAFESGLRLYSKVLEFDPQNTVAWTGQVRMLIELGEFREAVSRLKQREPDYSSVRRALHWHEPLQHTC